MTKMDYEWLIEQMQGNKHLEMNALLHDANKRVKKLERLLIEIRDYQSYSWNNDKDFIDSRIREAFKDK